MNIASITILSVIISFFAIQAEGVHTNSKNPPSRGRIFNGAISQPKQFPYVVRLETKYSKTNSSCGAALISKNFLLTAAHCLDEVISLNAILGAWDKFAATENGRQVIHVEHKDLILHKSYNRSTIQNDIALIRLTTQQAKFDEYVQPIALPNRRQTPEELVNKKLYAQGWGGQFTNDPVGGQYLKYIHVPVIDNKECNSYYSTEFVTDINICISTKDHNSTCIGDSGGPLVLPNDPNNGGRDTVHGVLSLGSSKGCEIGYPTVFSRVTAYLDWIEENTGIKIE